MPTGKGKTLVALIHIIYYITKLGNSIDRPKIIFIANTIQLVKQQHQFLKRQYNQVKKLLKENK